jgi:hypothetical protein
MRDFCIIRDLRQFLQGSLHSISDGDVGWDKIRSMVGKPRQKFVYDVVQDGGMS